MDAEVTNECRDYAGTLILFTENLISHITKRHPELLPYVDRIPDVLQEPNVVVVRYQQQGYSQWYYKLGVTSGNLTGTYLAVVVRFNQEDGNGLIKTVLAPSKLTNGRTIYMGRPS